MTKNLEEMIRFGNAEKAKVMEKLNVTAAQIRESWSSPNRKSNENSRLSGTVNFCTWFLNPRWQEEYYKGDKIDFESLPNLMIREWSKTYVDTVAGYIKSIPYNDFLATLFWKCLTHEVRKFASFHCERCSSEDRPLEIHHKTYEHHGYEIRYRYEDLICLCDSCHAKEHGKSA